ERPVKLRQFLHGSAEIRIRDMCPCWNMTGQWVENERARCRQHIVCPTNREQRPDATALSTLASDFQSEFQGRLENGGFTPRNPRAQGLECGDRHRVLPSSRSLHICVSMPRQSISDRGRRASCESSG